MPVTPWTYSGNPQNSTLDSVRFLIEDTASLDPQLNDNEINYMIGLYPSIWRASANLAKILKSKYARLADKHVGDLSVAYSQRQKAYEEMSNYLFSQADARGSVPYSGGLYAADQQTNRLDTSIQHPHFTDRQFNFPKGEDNGSEDTNGFGG